MKCEIPLASETTVMGEKGSSKQEQCSFPGWMNFFTCHFWCMPKISLYNFPGYSAIESQVNILINKGGNDIMS